MSTDNLRNIPDLKLWVEKHLKLWKRGSVILLSGELGAGKTTLVRTVIQCLGSAAGIDVGRIVSPTFTFHQSYPEVPNSLVEHFDLYRLGDVNTLQLVELGYFDAIERVRQKGGYCFVEWPERSKEITILEGDIHYLLELKEDGTRFIKKVEG